MITMDELVSSIVEGVCTIIDWFRKIIGWPVAWALYGMGHCVSRCPMPDWECLGWTYTVYNRLMIASLRVNDWAGLDIWGPPEHANDRRPN